MKQKIYPNSRQKNFEREPFRQIILFTNFLFIGQNNCFVKRVLKCTIENELFKWA